MTDLSKIEEIYHAALQIPETERSTFVKAACSKDNELFREVMSLIALDHQAGSFIESPPDDLAADIIAAQSSPHDIVGKTLGKYRVVDQIGAGGMGEVFLAEDIKLDRKVALKILPSQFSSDPERQLHQEGKAISALNHRNIITIYDIEEIDGVSFMVTEFVDGSTLRDKMRRSPLPWNEAITIAIQIASALSAAHSLGIIHRDIKPANVMVRDDGDVKVLDFGLAKLTTPSGQSGSFATRDHTAQNRVMGSINYMSPEQALGEKLDARTDIFSLGVVIYEMVTGIQPFAGSSDAAVYNATINKTPPPIGDSNPSAPKEVDRVLELCLAKKVTDRYPTADDLRQDLRTLLQPPNQSGLDFSLPPQILAKALSWKKPLLAAAALLIACAAVYAVFNWKNALSSADAARNFNFSQLTSDGDATGPSLSPDGKTVIFSSKRLGNWDIFYQRVGGGNAINLTAASTSDDRQAAFSPDGEQIAFSSNRKGASGIFLMGATGENVRQISDFGYDPAWSPDGKKIVFATTPTEDPVDRAVYPAALWTIDIASGERRELTKVDAVQPKWSPHGDRIAFWSISGTTLRDIKTIPAAGGEVVSVTDDAEVDWDPVWSPDGKYLFFASNRGGSMNFWRVAIDEKTGQPGGPPTPFTTPSVYSQNLSFSADGKVFIYAQQVNTENIVEAALDTQAGTLSSQTNVIGRSSRLNRNPSVSPDGQWIAFDGVKDKQEDIYLMRRDGSDLVQLTNDSYKDRAPRWSSDGKQLAFYSDRSGKNETWVVNPNGSGLQQITFDTDPYGLLTFWSPDGKKIVQNVSQSYARIYDTALPIKEQTPF